MIRLALRQIRSDPGRSVLTCLGIAAIFATILVLQGFRDGLRSQLRDFALDRGVELIAAQAGVENMVGARSVIPQMVREQVEAVEGVELAHPMTALPVIYEKDGRKSAIFLAVVDSVGGPRTVEEGRLLEEDGEILIDRGLARIYDLSPGDDLTIAGYGFRIAGITEPTAALWTPFAFAGYDTLIDFYFESDLADDLSAFPLLSYLLIQLDGNTDRDAVAAGIEAAAPDVDVFTPAELALRDEALGESMLGAVLTVLIALAYVGGLVVVGLFMFTTAQARRRDLGILKALGFADRAVLASVTAEAVFLTAAAIPLGIALALLTAAGVHEVMPLYRIQPAVPGPLLFAVAASGVFSLLGAFIPFRFIRRLEPVEVFQA